MGTTRQHGSITIFLAINFVVIFCLLGTLIDGGRIAAATMQNARATELSAQAFLARFDEELKDRYGLYAFFLTPELQQSALELYYANLNGSVEVQVDSRLKDWLLSLVGEGEANTVDILQISSPNVTVEGLQKLNDLDEFERQILEHSKYRVTVEFIKNFEKYGNMFNIAEFADQIDEMGNSQELLNELDDVADEYANYYAMLEAVNVEVDNAGSVRGQLRYIRSSPMSENKAAIVELVTSGDSAGSDAELRSLHEVAFNLMYDYYDALMSLESATNSAIQQAEIALEKADILLAQIQEKSNNLSDDGRQYTFEDGTKRVQSEVGESFHDDCSNMIAEINKSMRQLSRIIREAENANTLHRESHEPLINRYDEFTDKCRTFIPTSAELEQEGVRVYITDFELFRGSYFKTDLAEEYYLNFYEKTYLYLFDALLHVVNPMELGFMNESPKVESTNTKFDSLHQSIESDSLDTAITDFTVNIDYHVIDAAKYSSAPSRFVLENSVNLANPSSGLKVDFKSKDKPQNAFAATLDSLKKSVVALPDAMASRMYLTGYCMETFRSALGRDQLKPDDDSLKTKADIFSNDDNFNWRDLRGIEKESSVFETCEIEYLAKGRANEKENFDMFKRDLVLMRSAVNYFVLRTCLEIKLPVEAISLAAASLAGPLAPIVRIAVRETIYTLLSVLESEAEALVMLQAERIAFIGNTSLELEMIRIYPEVFENLFSDFSDTAAASAIDEVDNAASALRNFSYDDFAFWYFSLMDRETYLRRVQDLVYYNCGIVNFDDLCTGIRIRNTAIMDYWFLDLSFMPSTDKATDSGFTLGNTVVRNYR